MTNFNLPLLRFWCSVTYLTTNGKVHTKSVRILAKAADLAAELAEKQIRADKRRKVQSIIFSEAKEHLK